MAKGHSQRLPTALQAIKRLEKIILPRKSVRKTRKKQARLTLGTGQGQGSAAWPDQLLQKSYGAFRVQRNHIWKPVKTTSKSKHRVTWQGFLKFLRFSSRTLASKISRPPLQSWPVQDWHTSKILWEVRRMSLTRMPYLGQKRCKNAQQIISIWKCTQWSSKILERSMKSQWNTLFWDLFLTVCVKKQWLSPLNGGDPKVTGDTWIKKNLRTRPSL